MHDPSLEAARAHIRASVRELLDELEIPPDGPGIIDLTLDESGVLELTVEPESFDGDRLTRFADQLRGIGLATDGVEHVRVSASQPDPAAKIHPAGVDRLVAIAGAKGGVGRTTITAALARILDGMGYDVGIFDCDVDTADIVSALAVDEPIHATPDGRPAPLSIDGIQLVSVDLVAGDRPGVWRGAMVHDVLVDLLGRAAWTERDVVLLDLPPGLGDAVYTTVQDVALHGAVVIQTATAMGENGALRAKSLLEANDVPVLAEVRNRVGPTEATVPQAGGVVDIPVDPALETGSFETGCLDEVTETALTHLAATIVETVDVASEPANAPLDLRGLPIDLADRQAVLEVADAPDGPPDLLVDHPAALVDLLEDAFGSPIAELGTTPDGETIVRPVTACL